MAMLEQNAPAGPGFTCGSFGEPSGGWSPQMQFPMDRYFSIGRHLLAVLKAGPLLLL
jgi:hypothetical protein